MADSLVAGACAPPSSLALVNRHRLPALVNRHRLSLAPITRALEAPQRGKSDSSLLIRLYTAYAAYSGFVDASDCPPKDRYNSSLLTSENLTDGFVECDYKTAGECVYFDVRCIYFPFVAGVTRPSLEWRIL